MKKKSVRKVVLAGMLAIWLIFMDQITKYYAICLLKGRDDVSVVGDVLHFKYLENKGAAFSMFHGRASFMVIVSILTFVVLVLFAYGYWKLLKEGRFLAERIAIIFLFGGAAGNLIDRVRLHYVVDFIYVKIIDFPVFNIADCYITCAVVFVIIRLIYCMVKKKESFIDVIF